MADEPEIKGKVEEVANVMKDKKKISEIMQKLRDDRTIVPNTMKMIEENQDIKRNVMNMARAVNANPNLTSQAMSLREKKKMQAKQDMIKSMAREKHQPGEVRCVSILKNSKLCPNPIVPNALDENRWCYHPIKVGGEHVIAICDSQIQSGKNKLASKLIGKTAYGPVIFLLLELSGDENEYKPSNMSCDYFGDLIQSEYNQN